MDGSSSDLACVILAFAAFKRFWAAMTSGLGSVASCTNHFKSNGASVSFSSMITFLLSVCLWWFLFISSAKMVVMEKINRIGKSRNCFDGILLMLSSARYTLLQ